MASNSTLDLVLAWLAQNQYRRASFDRLVGSVPGVNTYEQLQQLIRDYPRVFRAATIAGGAVGLALQDGYQYSPMATTAPPIQESELVVRPMPEMTTFEYRTSEAAYAIPPGNRMTPPPAPTPPVEVSPKDYVLLLVRRAAESEVSGSALNFAQAAVEAANALVALSHIKLDL